ncbi:hypothetical protein ACFFUE_09890 [Bergeyella porcorum]|uniref:hypothetical protein n=1 Tax=Bergeyella porcorum TaxID=1735111 RepID=UPI0035EDB1A0
MKSLQRLVLLFAFFIGTTLLFSQKVVKQEIKKPSEGKSLVYISKTGAGPLVNFRIYDKDKFLGVLTGMKYIVYECEPGEHLFWATSENRDYVEANLEPNKTYVLVAEGQMGMFVAGVNLKPLNPNEFKDKKYFYQIIKNTKEQESIDNSGDKSENIRKGLEKYADLKQKESSKIKILEPNWNFENADKPIKEN